MQRALQLTVGYCVAFVSIATLYATPPSLVPRTVVEEDIYRLVSPNNGAGPMWSYGCTTIVRDGERLFASRMETSSDVPIPCNTRWKLLERTGGKWQVFAEAEEFKQREPCPLGIWSNGELLLSVNDALQAPGPTSLPCKPHLLRFDIKDSHAAPTELSATWNAPKINFTEHSYRGLAIDRTGNRLLQMNIDASTSIQHWALLDHEGQTVTNGQITFPIRACYPQLALIGNAGHIMAISDIVEPVEEWRSYKFEQSKRQWDYVFRILYYSWSPDLTTQPFAEPIEIDNVESTGGHITNHDMWIAPDGSVYLIYGKQQVANSLHDKYFPTLSTNTTLELAIVKDGIVRERHTLMGSSNGPHPGVSRFHETADHHLYAIVHAYQNSESNILIPIFPTLDSEASVNIPLKQAFRSFFTANVRAGNLPSNTIDLIGHQKSQEIISYAQIELVAPN